VWREVGGGFREVAEVGQMQHKCSIFIKILMSVCLVQTTAAQMLYVLTLWALLLALAILATVVLA
jgi:hypothetical protein